jgi:hypothetical protein
VLLGKTERIPKHVFSHGRLQEVGTPAAAENSRHAPCVLLHDLQTVYGFADPKQNETVLPTVLAQEHRRDAPVLAAPVLI